ncbi:hypothetical protein [Lysinibacillus sp. NPDC056232]|uniref:hypothetical protein n=1 Tax=Lysinibacillus sp. NPDC056232 TaxID=3345756 RepID=UPI0035DD766D
MNEVVKAILSPSKEYKVEIIKRNDGLYTIEIFRWFECDIDYSYEYWSPITQGFSLMDTEESAMEIGVEQLKVYSGEIFDF